MLFFMAFPSSANAFVIDQFHAALTEADQDYRSASFYLRTGNPGVALLELQALSDKWQTLSKTFSDQPPGPYAKDPAWSATLGQISHQVDTALADVEAGNVRAAQGQLEPIRAALARLALTCSNCRARCHDPTSPRLLLHILVSRACFFFC